MSKRIKTALATGAAAAVLATTAGIAPAHAGPVVQPPQFSRYVWCTWWPVFCSDAPPLRKPW